MRKRLVNTEHHNDERFFDLSRDARYIYGHLLTHPQMTSFGLIRLTVGGLADECGLERAECEMALEQLTGAGRVEVDRLCLALGESYLEEPANPSVVTGWGKFLDLLPRTALVHRRLSLAVERLKERARDAGEKGESWTDAIPENLRERLVASVSASTSKPAAPAAPLTSEPSSTSEASPISEPLAPDVEGPEPETTVKSAARKPAAQKPAHSSVKRFPVVLVGGAVESSAGASSSTTTASTVYVTATAPAPLVMTSTAPLLVDPETIEVEPAAYEIEGDSGDLLDATDLFALVDPPKVETVVEVEPESAAAPEPVESPYTLPAVGLFPPPEPPTLPDLADLASPTLDESVGEGVEDGVGHGAEDGVEHPAEHGVAHGLGHGVEEGAEHPVPHGAGHGVGEGVEHGLGHPVGHGVEHRVGDGVAHSIFHLPSSRIHLPREEAGWLGRAPASGPAGVREAAGGDGDQVELEQVEFEFEVEDTDGAIIELPAEVPVVEYFEDPEPPPAMVPTEPKPEVSFWPEPELETAPEAEPELDPDPDPDPWPEVEASSELEPDPEPESGPGPGSEPNLDTGPEVDTEPDFEPEPEPDPTDPASIDLDPDTEADYQELLAKAEGVLGRNLEVEELAMLRTWCRDIPHRLIESAIVDGVQAKIRRLAWVGKRLQSLVEGHLAKHPELAEDDLETEQADALAVLEDDRLSGHLSETTRKLASAAVRKATSARRVRDILDQALES